jgi:hypothetical protein
MKGSFRIARVAAAAGAIALLTVTGCAATSSVTATSGGATSPSAPVSTSASAAPSARASSPSAATASTAPPATPAGGPVPAGFSATSVTFVSLQQAFVLGTAPCVNKPCTSILRTLNRGGTWQGLPAPVVPLGQPENTTGSAVWGIRFATPSIGFVFGNGLWETTDGGEHWAKTAAPGGSIVSLEVIDGQVLALTAACRPATGSGCSRDGTLARRPLAGGSWQVTAAVSIGYSVDGAELIATQAQVAAVLDGSRVLVTTDGGLTTAERPTPCTGPAPGGLYATQSVAVTGPTSLALLCSSDDGAMGSMAKSVYVSGDLGASWTKMAAPSIAGDPWQIAGGSATTLVVGAFSGASWLYSSGDGGARWSTALQADNGGMGWNDLGFTSPSDGVVVSGPAITDGNAGGRQGRLLVTNDGGAVWEQLAF